MSVEHGVAMVRECLESVLPGAVATALMHDAIDSYGRSPENLHELRTWVQGPLARVLATRLGQDTSEVLVLQIDAQLDATVMQRVRRAEPEIDVDVDVDVEEYASDEEDDEEARELERETTSLIRAIPHAVRVMVVAQRDVFARRMQLAVGAERVQALSVADEASVRHATFRANPNVVVVDATDPPSITPAALCSALGSLPDATLVVIYGDRTEYGSALRQALEPVVGDAVFLDTGDGVEPLYDLVLSRRKQNTVIPPPS